MDSSIHRIIGASCWLAAIIDSSMLSRWVFAEVGEDDEEEDSKTSSMLELEGLGGDVDKILLDLNFVQ